MNGLPPTNHPAVILASDTDACLEQSFAASDYIRDDSDLDSGSKERDGERYSDSGFNFK